MGKRTEKAQPAAKAPSATHRRVRRTGASHRPKGKRPVHGMLPSPATEIRAAPGVTAADLRTDLKALPDGPLKAPTRPR